MPYIFSTPYSFYANNFILDQTVKRCMCAYRNSPHCINIHDNILILHLLLNADPNLTINNFVWIHPTYSFKKFHMSICFECEPTLFVWTVDLQKKNEKSTNTNLSTAIETRNRNYHYRSSQLVTTISMYETFNLVHWHVDIAPFDWHYL